MDVLFCRLVFCLAALLAVQAVHAASRHEPVDGKTAPELLPFVPAGQRLIAAKAADFNRDSRPDYLLVVEKAEAGRNTVRTLLIVVSQADGTLKLQGSNDKVVFCTECGGIMGDPFAGLEAGPGTFSVLHYGGSNWRWSVNFRFDYSRADDAWLLARVDEQSFHTGDPRGTGKQYSLLPRLHYGKIGIRDFDPEDFIGRGLACSKTATEVAGRWQNARGGPFREISFTMPDQGGAVVTQGEDVIRNMKLAQGARWELQDCFITIREPGGKEYPAYRWWIRKSSTEEMGLFDTMNKRAYYYRRIR